VCIFPPAATILQTLPCFTKAFICPVGQGTNGKFAPAGGSEPRVPGSAYFYQARNQTESLVQTGSSDDRRKSPVELSFQEDNGAQIKISLELFCFVFWFKPKNEVGLGATPRQ